MSIQSMHKSSTHTQVDKFIQSVPPWGMTIRQIKHIHHWSITPKNIHKVKALMLDPAMVVPDGWSGCPKPFWRHLTAWRPLLSGLLSFFRGGLLPSLPRWQPDQKTAMHWTNSTFSCWSCCLDWGWCQLHNLDNIFIMQNMVFATHLSQRDVKQWNCSSHNCYHCSMWSAFLTRHLELQPSIPSSWLKWQPTSTYHSSVNPGLVWDYKEHEFCGLYALLTQRQNGAQSSWSMLIDTWSTWHNLTATHYNNQAWGDCFTLLPHTRACLKSSSKDSESTWGILKAVEPGEITATPKLMIIESKMLCKSSTAFSTVNCLFPRCGVMMIGSLLWQHRTLPTRDASISQATSLETNLKPSCCKVGKLTLLLRVDPVTSGPIINVQRLRFWVEQVLTSLFGHVLRICQHVQTRMDLLTISISSHNLRKR